MSKRFILSPLLIFIVLLAGYGYYTSNKGREILTAAHLVDGLAFATPVKMQVVQFYNMQGEFPASNAELGLPPPQSIFNRSVESVEVSPGGKITIVYKNALKKDSSIILIPSIPTGYSMRGIDWNCATESIDQSYFDSISMPCTYVAPGALSDLMESIAVSDEVAVRAAILAGANVNGALRGDVPLFSAISRNQYSIARQLISIGADINQRSLTNQKITPLIHAVVLGKEKMSELLMDNDANIDAVDGAGKTALMYAVEKKRESIVELLLSRGANPSLKDNRGRDAARYAKRYGRSKAINNLIETAVLSYEAALARNGTVGGVNDLMRAASLGDVARMRQLIAEGVAVAATDNFNATALHYALLSRRSAAANVLIESGITVNSADRDAFTPLMLAIKNGNSKIVGDLLRSGARVNVENKYQQSPFRMAIRYGYKDIVALLLAAGVSETADVALYETFASPAAKQESIDIQDLILGAGLRFERAEKNVEVLLLKAVQRKRIPVARFLLKNGADLNADIDGLPLHIATQSGAYEMTKFLVESGANIHAVTAEGQTALMLAVKAGNIRLVKYFLDAGAKTGVTDVNGLSALRMAKANFAEDIVQLLRQSKK